VDGKSRSATAVGVRRCRGEKVWASTGGRLVTIGRGAETDDLGAASADAECVVRVPRDAGQPAEDVLEAAAETDRKNREK